MENRDLLSFVCLVISSVSLIFFSQSIPSQVVSATLVYIQWADLAHKTISRQYDWPSLRGASLFIEYLLFGVATAGPVWVPEGLLMLGELAVAVCCWRTFTRKAHWRRLARRSGNVLLAFAVDR